MQILRLLPWITATVVAAPNPRVAKSDFAGYQVYRVEVPSDEATIHQQLEKISVIEVGHNHGLSGRSTVDVAVPPAQLADFNDLGFTASLLSADLGADLLAEGPLGDYTEVGYDHRGIPSIDWFDTYHAYEDHLAYWADLQASFPDNSELIEIGSSFEGRPLQGIHLWGSAGKDSRPAIFFNGNVHAREWITSKVVEYIVYQIIIGYENDTIVQSALDGYDFYIIPVVNPDGFVYTQITNRLWRKNRQVRDNTTAVGTDINRNWSVGFGGEGSSPTPSSETFSGYQPFDTPECAALSDFALQLASKNGVKLYVDWHSYAQTILLSYGYTCTDFPENYDDQYNLAAGVSEAIAGPYNTTFVYGSGCLVLYQSSGAGRDFMTDAAGAEYGWGIELRDTQYGFVLPPEQILPSGIEIWEGMKYLFANF
ncbi:hypothetical protein F4778DRAFT_73450 [Xylariomycetidae sp. FL2044]|nr:hypothetical protein F4778DRAFT_73450 [Xylariomycetidae sp. FL2044]